MKKPIFENENEFKHFLNCVFPFDTYTIRDGSPKQILTEHITRAKQEGYIKKSLVEQAEIEYGKAMSKYYEIDNNASLRDIISIYNTTMTTMYSAIQELKNK